MYLDLFFSSFLSMIINNSTLRLFADDSLVYHRIKSQADEIDLQSDLDNLAKWADTWQMCFNVSKCEFMRVERQAQASINNPSQTYNLNATQLSHVSSVKYLGVHIDAHLSFDKHIREICKKATRTLHMLMRNLKKAKTKTKTVSFKTICRPILEYASHGWSPHLGKHIDVMEAINRKAFRWAYQKRRSDHISAHMAEVGWQTLFERRKGADLKLYFKIIIGAAAVNEEMVTVSHSHHHTRIGATKALSTVMSNAILSSSVFISI